MEGSRRGKGSREKGLPTPDPHVDGGNGKKTIVYNTKKEKKREDGKKIGKKKKKEKGQKVCRNTTAKGKNLVLLIIVLGHVRGYFLYTYTRITLSF